MRKLLETLATMHLMASDDLEEILREFNTPPDVDPSRFGQWEVYDDE